MLSLLALLGSVKNVASKVIFNTSVFRVYNNQQCDTNEGHGTSTASNMTDGPVLYTSFTIMSERSIMNDHLEQVCTRCTLLLYVERNLMKDGIAVVGLHQPKHLILVSDTDILVTWY